MAGLLRGVASRRIHGESAPVVAGFRPICWPGLGISSSGAYAAGHQIYACRATPDARDGSSCTGRCFAPRFCVACACAAGLPCSGHECLDVEPALWRYHWSHVYPRSNLAHGYAVSEFACDHAVNSNAFCVVCFATVC